MRNKLSFTPTTEKAKNLQIAAVIPTATTTSYNSSTIVPPHLRARVPIQSIAIPAAAVTPTPNMVNIATTTGETSVSSSHSSTAAAALAKNSKDRVGGHERSSDSSRHRRRSRSPFKLFRRPFQTINKGSSSSSQSVPVTSTTTTRGDDQEQRHHHHRMTRSVEPHTTAPATPTTTAGNYEKEKLQQDFTEVTESTGTTATSTVSERAARRQQLVVTESHPHALTTRRSSTEATAADVSLSTSGQRKHSGTAAFMGGSRSSSKRSTKNELGSSSLDTEEDLREQEAAATAGQRPKSKSSSSSSSRNRLHSRKTKKVPRVKESRIVWTKGMHQDYQQRHEAAKAAAEAAANNSDNGTDKSLSTMTLTAHTSSSKYQQQQYKLYLLLLNPTSKIFELIQLIYAPATTTVGDILKLIPPNATEPALASQQYTGLTRPKRSSPHFMNLSMLASNSPANGMHEEGIQEDDGQGHQLTAGIGHGEIMLAIPHGFTPQHVIRLAKQILANPRIQALLHAANPLHKHGHDRQSRHHHCKSSSSRHHSSSSELPGAAFSNGLDESGAPTRTSPGGGLVRRNTMESVHEEYATQQQPTTPVRDVPTSLKAAATAGIPIIAVTPSPMKNQHAMHQHGSDYQKTATHDQTTPVHSNAAAGYSHHVAVSSPPLPISPHDHDTTVFAAAGPAQQLQQQRMSLDSFIRVNNQAAAAVLQQLPLPALGGTYEEASVDMSYSSWSQSVDSSFSSLVSTSMRSSSSSLRSTGSSFRSVRNSSINSHNINGTGGFQHARSTTVSTTAYLTNSRRQRHVKFVKHIKGMALVTFGFMVAFYFVDPAGYAATHGGGGMSSAAATARLQLRQEQPLGMCGTVQALIVMFFLVKFQLFLQVTPPSAEDGIGDEDAAEYQYKCPFLQATTVGMERLRKQLRRHRRRQQQQRSQKRY